MKQIKIYLFIALFLTAGWVLAADYSTPEKTFELYKKVGLEGDVEQYLQCLYNSSRRVWNKVKPPKEMIEREVNPLIGKTYKIERYKTSNHQYAVIVFNDATVDAPPYILLDVAGEWKIDLKLMIWKISWDGEKYKFRIPFEDDEKQENVE
ncbi:MAG: hypothetical protein U9Q21_00625 [Candidatus Auribacterota bacterium]|nr:hypothetical protein [Candidatus Auribacterota bacterium]